MTPSLGATEILTCRNTLDAACERFAERARNVGLWGEEKEERRQRDKVLARSSRLLDDWLKIAEHFQETGGKLRYQKYEEGNAQRLLYDFLDPELIPLRGTPRANFRANRSMRDVEPGVELVIENLNDWSD